MKTGSPEMREMNMTTRGENCSGFKGIQINHYKSKDHLLTLKKFHPTRFQH